MAEAIQKTATQFVKFLNASPSPYHCVATMKTRLLEAGYVHLSEGDSEWKLSPGGKYFITRNASTLAAFALGGKFTAGNGFSMVGAHTDSPVLKLKPHSAVTKGNYLAVGVEPYGGGTWPTWFDRELSISGRAVVARGEGFSHELVRLDKGVTRISNIAIHLQRELGTKLEFNKQTHLLPILATKVKAALNAPSSSGSGSEPAPKHHPVLLKLLAEKLGCHPEDIRDFDLNMHDAQPAAIGGACDEFVFSARLDNQGMCFAALEALLAAQNLENDVCCRVAVFFDNEEVGSTSAQGADSTLMNQLCHRITSSVTGSEALSSVKFEQLIDMAFRKSFLLSADMAHALHPAYEAKYEPQHSPALHSGPVIKHNANQRYATTAPTAWVIREICRRHSVPVQDFVVRNDSPCGSTIGPMMSANMGVRTMDMGAPCLSMHSIREVCGTDDIWHSTNMFRYFYEDYAEVNASLKVDHVDDA